MKCASKISEVLAPIIEKRKYYENNIKIVQDILDDGEKRAKKTALATIEEVRTKMKLG
jgi:tryptophanyl-tRNA synthetase